MAATAETIEFDFVNDNSDYYLVGDQMAHGGMFMNYTISAISRDPDGSMRHVLELPSLGELGADLVAHGWQKAIFIGKLMTTSAESERLEIEDSQQSNKKSWTPRDEKLVPRHVGFGTGLFVVQSAIEYRGELVIASGVEPTGIPQLVAGLRSGSERSIRILTADVEEHYCDDQYGAKIKDSTNLNDENWEIIETFERVLYDRLSDAMAAHRPGEEPCAQLAML